MALDTRIGAIQSLPNSTQPTLFEVVGQINITVSRLEAQVFGDQLRSGAEEIPARDQLEVLQRSLVNIDTRLNSITNALDGLGKA